MSYPARAEGWVNIFVRELKKLWNIRVTVIPIVVCTLVMVPIRLGILWLKELEIRERIKTIQITTLWRSARIPEEKINYRPEKTCCYSDFIERPPVLADMKNWLYWHKKEWKDRQILRFYKRAEKAEDMKVMVISNCCGISWSGPQGLGKGTGRIGA